MVDISPTNPSPTFRSNPSGSDCATPLLPKGERHPRLAPCPYTIKRVTLTIDQLSAHHSTTNCYFSLWRLHFLAVDRAAQLPTLLRHRGVQLEGGC